MVLDVLIGGIVSNYFEVIPLKRSKVGKQLMLCNDLQQVLDVLRCRVLAARRGTLKTAMALQMLLDATTDAVDIC